MLTALRQRWRAYRYAIEARVVDGAELLDGQNPGWMWRVERRRIDVMSTADCPLGQVYGRFGDGLAVLWPDLAYDEVFVTHAVAHGFASSAALDRRRWPARTVEAALLRRAWVAAVDVRRHRSATTELIAVDYSVGEC